MSNSSVNFVIKHSYLWLLGWLSLGLIEVGLRLTMISPTLTQMLLFTLLVYSLVGAILGSLFGIITLLIQHILKGMKGPYGFTHFSMAACISTIIFLYILLFFLKETLYVNSPILTFKNVSLFFFSIATLFLLPFFFQWMDRKGRLFISYLSLLPSLWIITSLKLNRGKELLPSALQVTTFSRVFFLLFGAILCFFLVYVLFSSGRVFLHRWKGSRLLKQSLIFLLFIFLFLFLSLFLREGENESNKNEIKNAPIGKPNIILITMDATRSDHLSCYGYERLTTPNLDKFSREGLLFKNAYATDSWTLPSHASIFTGKYPSRHGAHYNSEAIVRYLSEAKAGKKIDIEKIFWNCFPSLSKENHTLAEVLSEKGYRTAGVIGGVFCSSIYGFGQGFDYYNENFLNVESDIKFFLIYQVINSFSPLFDISARYGYYSKRLGSHLNKVAFQWLEKNHGNPFFLFIHYVDTHNPYLPPPPYNEYFGMVDKRIIRKHNPKGELNYITAEGSIACAVTTGDPQFAPEKELLVSQYDGEIRYLDHCLGLLFEKLKTLNIYENTLIIITSDHGEAFGEHALLFHDRVLYEEVLRVPLIIKYPYSSRRGVIEKQVSLVDLFPTILSLLNYPIPPGIDGEPIEDSNHPIIAENHIRSAFQDTEKRFRRDLKTIYQGKYKYIWASNGLHELYDLEKDPREKENLIARLPRKAEAMEEILNQWLASFRPQKTGRKEGRISSEIKQGLRALGYIK